MTKTQISQLRDRADAAETLDETLLHDAAVTLHDIFPDAPAHPELLSDPTEGVLSLIDRCLPGWTIALRGQATEPDGHWTCTLRESASRDSDAVIGSGRAPAVSLALLRALLGVAAVRVHA